MGAERTGSGGFIAGLNNPRLPVAVLNGYVREFQVVSAREPLGGKGAGNGEGDEDGQGSALRNDTDAGGD